MIKKDTRKILDYVTALGLHLNPWQEVPRNAETEAKLVQEARKAQPQPLSKL